MIKWPDDYGYLVSSGLMDRLTDANDPLIIWDAEFKPADQTASYEALVDQAVDIVPFAMTGAGDYWAYLAGQLPDSGIALCYRDSYEAEHFANNLSQFIFRQTVAFAGCEDLASVSNGWSAKAARVLVSRVCLSFSGFIPRPMIKELELIATKEELNVADGRTTLTHESLAQQLIADFIVIDRDSLLFDWRA